MKIPTHKKYHCEIEEIEFLNTRVRRLILLILFTPLITFGQSIPSEIIDEAQDNWSYFDDGNPIDGKSRNAIRIKVGLDGETQTVFMLRVRNEGDEVKIKNATGHSESDRNDVWPYLNTSISINSLEKVQMYFDDDDKYYNINYLKYSEKGLIIFNGISNDNADYLSRFHFINLLKVKKEVFFRYKFRDNDDVNFSFLLNGSSKAINQAVNLSDFSFDEIGTKTDYIFDCVVGIESLNEALDELENKGVISSLNTKREDLFDDIFEYLVEEYGEYVLTYARYKADKFFSLTVTNLNDEPLTLIDLNIFKKEPPHLMEQLYAELIELKYDLPSFEEFVIKMSDRVYRKEIWKKKVGYGSYFKTFEAFEYKYSLDRYTKVKFLYDYLIENKIISQEMDQQTFDMLLYKDKVDLYYKATEKNFFESIILQEFMTNWSNN